MHPVKFSYTPADDDTNGFADDITGAGPFTMTATSSSDGLAHIASITSTANLSGITLTLSGLDPDGIAQTEDITGPNNTTVYGTKYWLQLDTVTASSTLGANTADVGWKDECVSPTHPLNWRGNEFGVALAVDVSGTINYTVQHCFERMSSGAPSTLTWWNHASLASSTSDADGNYAFPVTATRLKVNSLTAGATIAFHVVQAN